jgi:hypothetical protein
VALLARNIQKASVPGMEAQIAAMTAAKDQMADLTDKMTQMNAAVPSAFETAKDNYLVQIDSKRIISGYT